MLLFALKMNLTWILVHKIHINLQWQLIFKKFGTILLPDFENFGKNWKINFDFFSFLPKKKKKKDFYNFFKILLKKNLNFLIENCGFFHKKT